MFITIEGLDCVGKTTLMKGLSENLSFLATKEPGSPHIASNVKIREIVLNDNSLEPFQRELLFYVDALSHKQFINEKLEKSEDSLIISDRGILTHYAYLYGYMKMKLLGRDADENYTRYKLCKSIIAGSCKKPDAVIYLSGDVALMRERARPAQDAIESLPSEYFAYVLAQFDDLIELQGTITPTLILNARDTVMANIKVATDFLGHLHTCS